MSDSMARENQALLQSAIVTMFEIDASSAGEGVLRFSTDTVDGGPVRFNGYEYVPLPITASGFQWSGKGKLPRPRLKVSALSISFLSLVIAADDLVGMPIRRLRTYRKYLDDGADPDPDALFHVDHYVFERKARDNPTAGVLEFELSVEMDQQGRMVPARQVLRDACTQRYRRWDAQAQAFDYSKATCPYAGGQSYDRAGNPVPDPEDRCGKRLSDCRLRFGQNGELPTWAFPGVGRVR